MNYRLPVYFFPIDDPLSAGTDAFLQTFDELQAYAFSPFASIRLVLNKLLVCKGTYLTLIALFWLQKEWFPELHVWLWLLRCPFHFRESFSNSRISIACTRTSPCFAFMRGNYSTLRPHSRSFKPGRHSALALPSPVLTEVVPALLRVL